MTEEQALAYLTSMCRTLHDHRPELLQPMRGRWSGPDADPRAPSGLIYRRGAVLAIVSPWDVPVVTPGGPVGFMPPADSELWLHVSVSRPDRPPTYDELTDARNQLFRPTDTVLHVWPPRDEHFNLHPHCLHLWTPMNGRRPVPDLRGLGGGV